MLNGAPLANVLIEIERQRASTDATGRFLIENITPGHHVMLVDGEPANGQGQVYGLYKIGVDIQPRQTNVLPYTIWMTPLDTEHVVAIPSPTTSDMVVTTPSIPGLELHIPADTVIRDARGRLVTKIGITPIPMDRPPFPLKRTVQFPVYFTIQPGGASFSHAGKTWSPAGASGAKGARIYYQNYAQAKPGTPFEFWNYDPAEKGWYVYGKGRVSRDGKMIVPDQGVQIWEFNGAMISQPGLAPPNGPNSDECCDGDPVDLQTGLFVYRKTDLVLSDVIPIVLTRTYRQDDFISRAFGIGTNMAYDMFLVGDTNVTYGWTYQDLILADGGRVHFTRTSPCSTSGVCDYTNATYSATSTPDDFYGATMRWSSGSVPQTAWVLTKKDGTVYEFPDSYNSTSARKAAVIAMHDRYGNKLSFNRDSNGNLLKITTQNGRWVQFTYDASNRVTQAQDNIGRTVIYTYDAGGRLYTVTDANGGVTTYTYDANHSILTIQNPRQITYVTNEYDENNRVKKQTHVDGGMYQFVYTLDAEGKVAETDVTDPRGYVRKVTFNNDGYLTGDTKAFGTPEQQAIAYTRQPGSGFVLTTTDTLNRQTAYTYDAMGNTTSITRLAGTANAVPTYFGYDPRFNQLATITDPLGHATSFTYDDKGNLVATSDALGNTTSTAYNAAGQPLITTDPMGNPTQFSYDLGDLVAIIDPLGRTTSRFVDAAGRLASVKDPLGRITQYTYDPVDRITSTIDPLGNETVYTYDENGNLKTLRDANQHSTTYTYSNIDRVERRTDPLQNFEEYQYDPKGNLTQFTDRRGKITTYVYDGLGRRTFAGFDAQPGPVYESTISYTYDAANRLTTVVDSITGTITRAYDDLDRLASETTAQGTVTYTYGAAGRRQTMTVAGQPTVNYSYDDANRLTEISQDTANVLFSVDSNGRRTSLTLPNGVVASYSYDAASQLLGITYSTPAVVLGDLAYTYDVAGRRVNVTGSFARTELPQAVSATAYNENNQLTQWGAATLTYDLNGNLQSDGASSFTWDGRNQLVAMNSGGAVFQYDPLGRRVGKTVLGSTTNYLYDGVNPVQELAGTMPAAKLLAGGIDEYFARTDTTGTVTFLTDALGSTLALADSAGTMQTQYSYEPFGKTTSAGATTTNTLAYTGRELDGTGLYYYRARYYDPRIGRFISEDPLEFTSSPNFYSYANNRPIDLVDPSGAAANPIPWLLPKPIPNTPAIPVLLILFNAAMAEHDWHEFQRLCQASGWAWCTPPPSPAPSPSPSPTPLPSSRGRTCENNDRGVCEQLYQEDMAHCEATFLRPDNPDTPGFEACAARALLNFERCLGWVPGAPPRAPMPDR